MKKLVLLALLAVVLCVSASAGAWYEYIGTCEVCGDEVHYESPYYYCETVLLDNVYCAVCETTVSATIYGLGHEKNCETYESTICTEESYERWYCLFCDYELIDVIKDAEDHELAVETVSVGSCTEDSIIRNYCVNCEWEESIVTPAPGHDLLVSYIGIDGAAFSCETGGTKVTQCQRESCLYESSEEISAGHQIAYEISVSTNCTDDSYERKYCTFCDWEEIIVTPAPGHDLVSAYIGNAFGSSFSCESGGYKQTWCKRDLCTYKVTEEIPPGHVFIEVSCIKPTYHSTGTQTLQCDACGYREYVTIPVLIDDGMSPDVYSMGQAFMSGTWKLFGIYVPGFGFTFGGLLIGVALVSISLSIMHMLFGFGRRGGSVSARTGSTNKAKISKEREKDER